MAKFAVFSTATHKYLTKNKRDHCIRMKKVKNIKHGAFKNSNQSEPNCIKTVNYQEQTNLNTSGLRMDLHSLVTKLRHATFSVCPVSVEMLFTE